MRLLCECLCVYVCLLCQATIYGEVKRAAETRLALMTQCVAVGNASKPGNLQTNVNIALKVGQRNLSAARLPTTIPSLRAPCMGRHGVSRTPDAGG
jgi:hypothetical protein